MTAPAPTFVSVPAWRWRAYVHPPTWVVGVLALMGFTLVALAGVAAVAACIGTVGSFAGEPWGAGAWAAIVGGAGAIVAAAALACRGIGRWASRRTAAYFASVIPEQELARGLMLAELRESGPPRDGWSGAHATRWVEEVRRHSRARIFVSRGLEERVRRYDVTDRPVEPERMGGPMGPAATASVAVFALLAGIMFWIGGTRTPMAYVFAGLAIAALVRLARRRALFAPVVAGQGWIEHGSARWTVEDSVILATGWSTAKVRAVGPAGVLTVTLPTGRGKEFEALWTRWMHPAPDLRQRAFDA